MFLFYINKKGNKICRVMLKVGLHKNVSVLYKKKKKKKGIKSAGSTQKFRVGRVSGNSYFIFSPYTFGKSPTNLGQIFAVVIRLTALMAIVKLLFFQCVCSCFLTLKINTQSFYR